MNKDSKKKKRRNRVRGDDIAKEAKAIIPEVIFHGKRGQPTKYKEHYCEGLIKHMSEGLSFESFCAKLPEPDGTFSRVDRDTIYSWLKEFKEFSDAKKIGTDANLLFWEQIGVLGITGRIHNFNAVAYIFNMKNRFGWGREDSSREIESENPVVILPSNGREIKND